MQSNTLFRQIVRKPARKQKLLPGKLPVLLLAVAFGLSAALAASAQEQSTPGALLWQDRRNDSVIEVAHGVATNGSRIAVLGFAFSSPGPTSTSRDSMLRVYDASSGVLQWESRFDLSHRSDDGQAVAISDSVVIAAGSSTSSNGHISWIVSSYDASSGSLLWRDELQRGAGDFKPEAVAIRGHRAFVTGVGGEECSFLDVSNCDQLTRAYDLKSGELLWEVQYDAAGADDDSLFVAADERLVYVAGSAGTTPGDELTYSTVRAYDARTGALAWADAVPDPTQDGFNFKVAVAGGRVFAAGITNDDWLVRAYDARSGVILWGATYSLLGFSAANVLDAPIQMDANEDFVSVGGYGSSRPFDFNRNSRDWVMNTYDSRSGQLVWTDRFGIDPGADEANNGMVLASGQTIAFGFAAGGAGNWLVRSYDTRTGRVLWEDRPSGALAIGIYTDLAAACGRVTAVGANVASSPGDWLVRTYSLGREDSLFLSENRSSRGCEERSGDEDGGKEQDDRDRD